MKNNCFITAYSPLARGLVNESDILITIGKKYNKTPCQIALRWLLQKNIIIIPKGSTLDHLKENIDIFDFELNDIDMSEIDELNINYRIINPSFSDF